MIPLRRALAPAFPLGGLRLRRVGRARTGALLAAAAICALAGTVTSSSRPAAAAFAPAGVLPGLATGRIWSVAGSPATPGLVLAGTDAGVYRSTDGGTTWTQTAIRGVRVWTVGFSRSAPPVAYAGLADHGVRRSDDGGATWSDVSTGLPSPNVRVLAFGLAGIAAGTSSGVAVSTDGHVWRPVGLGGFDISALALSANQPQFTLIAGADRGDLSQGFLFRNTAAGGAWETLTQGLPASAFVSAVVAGPLPQGVPNRPLVVATNKGMFHSGDGGNTWTASNGLITGGNPPEQVILTTAAFSPLDPNLVYAGSDGGGSSGGALFRSTDGGANFGPANQGIPDAKLNVVALAVTAAPGQPPTVIAGLSPPNSASLVYRETDTTAPAPSPVAAESNPGPIPTATPTPAPRPAVKPPVAAPGGQSSLASRAFHWAVGWPFPLALELFLIALIAYLVVRWRQRYLDVEGPP